MATSCDLSHLLRPAGQARSALLYNLVGYSVARHALAARRSFQVDDVRLRLPRGTDPRVARVWAREWLGALAEGHRGEARGPLELRRACPKLAEQVNKYWRGY